MKFTLALVAALLAVCQIGADVNPGFAVNKQYKYEYKARAVTGLPKKNVKQFSGFGTKAYIIIQNQGGNIFVKFDNIEHGQFNEQTKADMAEEFHMDYTPLSGPYKFVEEALTKPVRVTVENGLVKSFDVDSDDPVWSVNVKRSLLGLFQLNFNRVNSILKTDSVDFYRVMEDGIGGECETVYRISHNPYYKAPFETIMNVTKHRNYDKCHHRAYRFCSTHEGYDCGGRIGATNYLLQDPLKFTSYSTYQIRGTRSQYTIERIYSTGKHVFAPFGVNAEIIMSGVNQTLFLTETTDITTPITFTDKFVNKKSLTYQPASKIGDPTKVDLTKPNYFNRHFNFAFKDAKEQIGKLLPILAEEQPLTDDLHAKNIPEKFYGLIKLLSTLSFDEIKEFYEKYLSYDRTTATPEKRRMQSVFFEGVVAAGTNPAIKFIMHILKDLPAAQSTSAAKIAHVFPFYVKEPTETLINEFFTFIKTIDKATKQELYKTMWLAFGTLVHKGCEKNHDHDTKSMHVAHKFHFVHPDTCTHYMEDVYKFLTEAKDTWEQLLYMKTIQNMHCPHSLPYMKPIINHKKPYPEAVRLQAMWSLAYLEPELKEEIFTILVPLYFNFSESVYVRLAAFEIIFSLKPPYQTLQYMAENLHKEPSRQVASYVYSSFVAAANSTNPCHVGMLGDVRKILATIPRMYFGYQYSQKKLYNYVNDKFLFAGETMVAWAGSNQSFIPEHFYIAQSANIFGFNVDYAAFGFDVHGFSRIFKHLFGSDGIFDPHDEDKSVFDIFRRSPRDVNTVKKELNEIKDAVNVVPRKGEDFEAQFYYYSFNQELGFKYYDTKSFSSLKDTGFMYLPKDLPKMLKEGKKINYQKMALLADITYEVPTEMGFPLSLSLKVPAYFTMTGEIKFEVLPSIFAEERDHKKATHVKLITDLKPVLHVEGIAKMGIKTPAMNNYGYGITHDLGVKFPLKLKMEYDVKEKKFHFNYTPSQKPYEMLHYSNNPFTYIDKMDNYIPLSEEPSVKPIVYRRDHLGKPDPHLLDYKLGASHFGANFRIMRSQQDAWDSFSSNYKYFKSFFTKSSRHFDPYVKHYNSVKKLICAYVHLKDYILFFPTMRPYDLSILYEPNKENPTTEYDFTVDFHKNFMTSTGPYVPDYTVKDATFQLDPTFRRVFGAHFQLVAKGNTERSYHVELNTSYPSLGDMPLNFDFDYYRTPLPGYDPEPFKMCYRSAVKLPGLTKYFAVDPTADLTTKLVQTINFGKNCDSDKKITIKTVFEKTDEQLEMDKHPSCYKTYDKCELIKTTGFNLSEACWNYFLDFHTLKKYTINIEYENLPPLFTHRVDKLSHWIKHKLFLNMKDINVDAKNPPNQIKIIANFSSHHPATLDLKVSRPTQDITYTDIYYPFYMPYYQHANLRISPGTAIKEKIFNHGFQPVCRIQANHVHTFDNAHYNATLSNCYHIAAKDCSKGERFTVLVKNVKHQTYTKAVKIFLLNHKIEILPIGENPETAPLVLRVDDVKRNLAPGSLFVMNDQEHKDRPLFKIFYVYGDYHILVPSLKLRVVYDGTFVNTKISNFFRGFMCGICGDSNGEVHNEFVAPSGCVFNNEITFVTSYLVPDGSCPVPAIDMSTCYFPYALKKKGN